MTLDNIAGFVNLLASRESGWDPTAFFDVNVERWQPVWDVAPEENKRALAHAYLWAWSNFGDSRYLVNTHREWSENVWSGQHAWFRTIKPYVDPEYVSKENLGSNYDWLQTILAKDSREGARPEYIALKQLWFGEENEQRQGLQYLVKNLKEAPFFVTGNLIPVLAWDLAERTGDIEVTAQAIVTSYAAGKDGSRPPTSANETQQAWTTLGYIDKRCENWPSSNRPDATGKYLSKKEKWGLEFSKNQLMSEENLLPQLRNAQPEATALALREILPRLGMDCGNNLFALYSTSYLGYLYEDAEGNTMAYSVLRALIPSKSSIWDSYEMLGGNVFEALKTAVGHTQHRPEASLPNDVLSLEGA